MKGNFRRSMIWLHTYSGLLLTWLIFAVFVTGTLSYYADELDMWMQPEKLLQQPQQETIPLALASLNEKAEGANRWNINLGSARDPKAEIRWQYPGQGRREGQRETLGEPTTAPRETVGGSFFVHFHYTLELRNYGGRYLTGIVAFVMLIGIFTGIFTHRRFFKDFFVLRWQNLKRALTDVHAIVGIVTLPFCFVICFSALLFYLSLYVPASASFHYDKGYRQLSSQVSPSSFSRSPLGESAQAISDIQPMLNKVQTQWPEEHSVSWVSYYYPYDKNGYLVFYRNKQDLSRQGETLTFDASSGELLHQTEAPRTPKLISYVFLGLHEAKFADTGLRFILFILGTLSCALIATGSILWLNSRVERQVSHGGTRLISWSNKAMFIGLPIGIIALFWANRLLPVAMDNRANYELLALFSAWACCGLFALLVKSHIYWRYSLTIFAIGCFLLPVMDMLSLPSYLAAAVSSGNLTFIAIELAFIISGILALILSRYLSKRNKASVQNEVARSQLKVKAC